MSLVNRKFLVHWPAILFFHIDQKLRSYAATRYEDSPLSWHSFRCWLTNGGYFRKWELEPHRTLLTVNEWLLAIAPYLADHENHPSANRYLNQKDGNTLGFIRKVYINSGKYLVEVIIVRDYLNRYSRYVTTVVPGYESVYKQRIEYLDIPVQQIRAITEALDWQYPEPKQIEKFRLAIPYSLDDEIFWEIDVYLGSNRPLITASIKLPPDFRLEKESWVGKEISSNPRYEDRNLALESFRWWGKHRGLQNYLTIHGEEYINLSKPDIRRHVSFGNVHALRFKPLKRAFRTVLKRLKKPG